MKKLVSLGIVSLMLIASLAVVPQNAQAQGPGLVSSILNKMERNRRDMRSLRASVTIQKYNAQIRDTDMSFGEVQYMPGQGRNVSVRLDIQRPQKELLAVSDGKYTLFKPRMNMAYVGNTNSAKGNGKVSGVLGFGLNMSSAQLKSSYNVELLGEGSLDGPHVWLLKFTPKGGANFKYAEVWVGDDGMPLQTRVTERNNDSTLVRLGNIQKNASIPSNVFKLDLGSGVKIVKG
ncbi:MAG TPA: outer-membrane lipoprotein carrier protein LolA [Pyrinomonadaceae bacterium]|jgi:outer membrane lipoprotein-sorting protein|nr:outer-membrane lipoprotein carrier protein LolA [Pyrinomonadaceae bacterium]